MIFVKKSDLYGALSGELNSKYRVIAPQLKNGRAEYLPIEGEPTTEVFPPTNSIKEFFFPRSETVLRFRTGEKELLGATAQDEMKLLLFGVRPCDADALGMFDAVFTKDYEDALYLQRREKSVVFTVACNQPKPDCFCTTVGGSPFGRSGCDVWSMELEDGFLVDTVTDKGRDAVAGLEARDATEDAEKKIEEMRKEAESGMKVWFEIEDVREKIPDAFEKDFWDSFSSSCLSCSICTFVCPTCHCFDITDIRTKGGAERVKTWDSCMSPVFTLHASGHNPRYDRYRRWRQRVFHKFQYLPENLSILGCVGCGRCVTHCPVGIDIRRMLQIVSGKESRSAEVTTSA